MFAVVLSMSAISPALAAANDSASDQGKKASNAGKINICHWQEEVPDDPLTTVDEFEPAEWVPIEISGNAEDAHVGVHTDGADFDDKIGAGEALADEASCTARN